MYYIYIIQGAVKQSSGLNYKRMDYPLSQLTEPLFLSKGLKGNHRSDCDALQYKMAMFLRMYILPANVHKVTQYIIVFLSYAIWDRRGLTEHL